MRSRRAPWSSPTTCTRRCDSPITSTSSATASSSGMARRRKWSRRRTRSSTSSCMPNRTVRCASTFPRNRSARSSHFGDNSGMNPESFLEAFANSVGTLVAYVDRDEIVQFVTRGFAEWFGTSREEIVGRRLAELYGPDAYAQFAPSVKRALAGEEVHYERQAFDAHGKAYWISVSVHPHRDASGEVVGIFSCALEVKELKRTHDALGRALEEIATHIENTPLGVVEWTSDLRVKRWSPQAEGIFGWRQDEVIGKTSVEIGLIHADSLEQARGQTREMTEGGAKRSRMLTRNVTREGRVIWCEWYNSAFFDESGRIASILSFAEDITARMDAEAALRQAAVEDALTGLPNRSALAARLEHAILRVNRSGDRL